MGVKDWFRRAKGMFSHNYMQSIADVLKDENITSDKMMEAINLWLDLFEGNAPWLEKNPQSLGLPALISSEVARSVTLEMEMNFSGDLMAQYIEKQFKPVMKNLRTNVEYACAAGGIVFKPYINGTDIVTEIVQANSFYPFAFDNSQDISGAYFLYRKWNGREIYSRLEKHQLVGTEYHITNQAYVSYIDDALGEKCALTDVKDWAGIEPEVVIKNIKHPLFSYFKMPFGNTVDISSPLGTSIYARAVQTGLIEEADKQFQRLSWEYSGGELAIDASEDVFRKVNGAPLLPEGKERLYRMNNLDAATTNGNSLLEAWTPELRDANYMSGLNRILIQIEDACSLSRGTLSDPTEVAKTASEIKIMKQRSWAMIKDIQMSLEDALDHLVYAMHTLATLYEVCPDGECNVNYQWDDSIVVDAETERIRDQQEVAAGLMLPYEYRVKWYGEDEATAKMKLGEIENLTDDEILGFNTAGIQAAQAEAEKRQRQENQVEEMENAEGETEMAG